MSSNKKRRDLIVKSGAITVMVAGLIVVTKQLGILTVINNVLQDALRWIDSLGTWGLIAFIIIYTLAAVFLIPGSILTLGAGVIFGLFKGSIIVSLASTLGATAAFLVGRYFTRGWVAEQIEARPKFRAIDEAVAKEGWKIVGLTRLSPVFPFIFVNYAFGITKVSLIDYIVASWIGMMPGTVMYVYLGSLIGDIATLTQSRERTPLEWSLYILGLIVTVIVTVYITKIARKALENQISDAGL